MAPSHIYITGVPDRLCPIPPQTATAPGAGLLMVKPGRVYRLPLDGYVRRRITAGDLVPCLRDGKPAAAVDDAVAKDPIEHVAADGSIMTADEILAANPAPIVAENPKG